MGSPDTSLIGDNGHRITQRAHGADQFEEYVNKVEIALQMLVAMVDVEYTVSVENRRALTVSGHYIHFSISARK